MEQKPAAPVCKAFLVCRQIVNDPNTGETILIGLPNATNHHHFPMAQQYTFFARLSSSHGEYRVEVQLQHDGEVVWSEGPPQLWRMSDPLHDYDLHLTMSVIVPKPATYDFVLLLNGDEMARQKFHAILTPPQASS